MRTRHAVYALSAALALTSCTGSGRLGLFSIASDTYGKSATAPVIAFDVGPGSGESGLGGGVDVALAADPAGTDPSTFYAARAFYCQALPAGGAYLIGGGALVHEVSEATGTSTVGTVDVGAGIGLGERFDLKLFYSIFIGTENAPGAISLTAGYIFF